LDIDGQLYWRPGREAVGAELYLGSTREEVASQSVAAIIPPENRYPMEALGLEYGRTYYWKVNQLGPQAALWEGQTWSFTTIGYKTIDDFETYDDRCRRIFFAWVDGAGHSGSLECKVDPSSGNGTGSTVGNFQPPFAEQLITHSGQQSMPLGYDNTRSPYYSETVREFDTPQSWTKGGLDSLTIFLQGVPAAFLEPSAGQIIMNGAGANIGGFTDEFRFVYKSLAGNGSIVARVEGVGLTHPAAKAAVMIRQTLDPTSTYAMVVVTPASGIGLEWRSETGQNAQAVTQTGLTAPYWVSLTRQGDAFTARVSTDGVNWVPVSADPAASTVTIKMGTNVYIGLAVTSRVAGRACGARFSQVSTSGLISGSWQIADIGAVAQIQGNQPEPFYVGLRDASGVVKVVNHPDPVVIATGLWEQWDIPLSAFSQAGLDLGHVKAIILGVGNHVSPISGGTGTIYIDDIQLTRRGQ
jgi:hypothetical protein